METYNALHNEKEEEYVEDGDNYNTALEYDDDHDDHDEEEFHRFHSKKEQHESFDFNEQQSGVWNRYHMRRFYQDRGSFWTSSRMTTAWKWFLTVFVGVMIAFAGAFVAIFTETLVAWKLESCYELMVLSLLL